MYSQRTLDLLVLGKKIVSFLRAAYGGQQSVVLRPLDFRISQRCAKGSAHRPRVSVNFNYIGIGRMYKTDDLHILRIRPQP